MCTLTAIGTSKEGKEYLCSLHVILQGRKGLPHHGQGHSSLLLEHCELLGASRENHPHTHQLQHTHLISNDTLQYWCLSCYALLTLNQRLEKPYPKESSELASKLPVS